MITKEYFIKNGKNVLKSVTVDIDKTNPHDEEETVKELLKFLEEGYIFAHEIDNCLSGRLEYLSTHIFDYITYCEDCSEMFALETLKVLQGILDDKYWGVAKMDEHYKYLMICNMPFLQNRIEWGSSIRHVWFHETSFETCAIQDECVLAQFIFKGRSFGYFAKAMIEFANLKNILNDELQESIEGKTTTEKRRM